MGHIDSGMVADRLNRLVKLVMDTGEVSSVEEAERLFAGYRLAVAVGPDIAHSPTRQAALLTVVNAGRRSLLGGIEVEGVPDARLLVPLSPYRTIEEAVIDLGGRIVRKATPDAPLVVIGDAVVDGARPFAIRMTYEGWSAGIVPVFAERLAERQESIPAGVLAGGLAVGEAFQYLRGNQPAAGRRDTGLSLWRPELDWRDSGAFGPVVSRLPSAMWLIGLGNLGQAYLWIIGLLPYAKRSEVDLVLQDFDVLAESNDSTSLLTHRGLIGVKKSRAMAEWAENQGFKATIVERQFGSNFRVLPDEPEVALCGVDNGLARAALEDVGFKRVIEAGLGKGTTDFMGFRTHVFPGSRKAREIWSDTGDAEEVRIDLPAYQALAASGVDRCGLTQLAGRTVGAPFVGAVAAAVGIAELLRLVNGAHAYELVDGHLRDLNFRTVVAAGDLPPFNPGATSAR